MANTKSHRNQRKFISHRSQSIDSHRKSIYWLCVSRDFTERFLEQTITIFKPSGWKKTWKHTCKNWMYQMATGSVNFTISLGQYHSTGQYPVDTRRRFKVYKTSIRRRRQNDVVCLQGSWLFIRFFGKKYLCKSTSC